MFIFVVYMMGMFITFGIAAVKGPQWLEKTTLNARDWIEVFVLAFLMALIWPLIAFMMAIRLADNFIDGLER